MPTPICTLVFLLLYFSSLAAALWWALTTASWAVMVLCSLEPKVTCLPYDTERFPILQPSLQVLENKSPLLHTLGWGVPALLTITALVMHQVTLYCCQETKSSPIYFSRLRATSLQVFASSEPRRTPPSSTSWSSPTASSSPPQSSSSSPASSAAL